MKGLFRKPVVLGSGKSWISVTKSVPGGGTMFLGMQVGSCR